MWHDIRTMNTMTRILAGVLVLVLLFAAYKWLSLLPLFDLRAVQIQDIHGQPPRYVDSATVRSAALPRLRGNFFTTDLNATRTAFETVPWVHHASVRREWPDKLIIELKEYVALGTWGDDGRLLSVDGVVFTANLDEAEEEGKLPVLDGPEGSAREVAARLADLRLWLAPLKLEPRELVLSGRYAWTARLDNGVVLHLGREQTRGGLQAKVARFVSVYPQLAARLPNKIESVDMRYPNGLALRAQGLTLAPVKKSLPSKEDAT